MAPQQGGPAIYSARTERNLPTRCSRCGFRCESVGATAHIQLMEQGHNILREKPIPRLPDALGVCRLPRASVPLPVPATSAPCSRLALCRPAPDTPAPPEYTTARVPPDSALMYSQSAGRGETVHRFASGARRAAPRMLRWDDPSAPPGHRPHRRTRHIPQHESARTHANRDSRALAAICSRRGPMRRRDHAHRAECLLRRRPRTRPCSDGRDREPLGTLGTGHGRTRPSPVLTSLTCAGILRSCPAPWLARATQREPRVAGRRDLERVLGWFAKGATSPLEVRARRDVFAGQRFADLSGRRE